MEQGRRRTRDRARALFTRQESKQAVGQRRVDLRVKGSPSQSVHQSVSGWGLASCRPMSSASYRLEWTGYWTSLPLFFFSCFVRRYVNFLARLILSLSANTSRPSLCIWWSFGVAIPHWPIVHVGSCREADSGRRRSATRWEISEERKPER